MDQGATQLSDSDLPPAKITMPGQLPPGYLLPPGATMQDVLRQDAGLLASEGIDPSLLTKDLIP